MGSVWCDYELFDDHLWTSSTHEVNVEDVEVLSIVIILSAWATSSIIIIEANFIMLFLLLDDYIFFLPTFQHQRSTKFIHLYHLT